MKAKKFANILAALAMAAAPLTLCGGVVSAESADNYEYEILEDSTVKIVYYDRYYWEWYDEESDGSADQVIEIPQEIEDRQVTVIGYGAFRNNPNIKEIIIRRKVI